MLNGASPPGAGTSLLIGATATFDDTVRVDNTVASPSYTINADYP